MKDVNKFFEDGKWMDKWNLFSRRKLKPSLPRWRQSRESQQGAAYFAEAQKFSEIGGIENLLQSRFGALRVRQSKIPYKEQVNLEISSPILSSRH